MGVRPGDDPEEKDPAMPGDPKQRPLKKPIAKKDETRRDREVRKRRSPDQRLKKGSGLCLDQIKEGVIVYALKTRSRSVREIVTSRQLGSNWKRQDSGIDKDQGEKRGAKRLRRTARRVL